MRRFRCLRTYPATRPLFFRNSVYELIEECRHGMKHYLRMASAAGGEHDCDPADFEELKEDRIPRVADPDSEQSLFSILEAATLRKFDRSIN